MPAATAHCREQERRVDEETPLLRARDCASVDEGNDDPRDDMKAPLPEPKETPIPWAQFSLVLFLQLAEPLTSQVIYPFIPQLIREIGITHGDETKVGYYVGMMQSIFFATQALTVLHWSQLSDHIGRKPVILTGLAGLALSMYCFGLARTFPALVAARSLAGALNGNIGVVKSVMGELTDESNVGRAFAYQPIAWSSGATIGPLIGGALAHPAERFPRLFGSSAFLKTHPYFLPCAIPATFSIVVWLVSYFFLKETNPTGFRLRNVLTRSRPHADRLTSNKRIYLGLSPSPSPSSSRPTSPPPPLPAPPPLRTLLTPRVVLSAGNYALLSLVDIAYRALQPVFYATPVRLGGLGLAPPTIGLVFALLGACNGVFQVCAFARVLRWLGARRMYVLGVAAGAPIFLAFPAMSALVRWKGEVGWAVWAVMGLQLAMTLPLNMCYSCIFIYITHAAPSRRALGATNGLAQTSVSLMRAVGPAVASGLYSLSLALEFERGGGPLAGALVWGVMLGFVGVAVAGGAMLPREVWPRAEE